MLIMSSLRQTEYDVIYANGRKTLFPPCTTLANAISSVKVREMSIFTNSKKILFLCKPTKEADMDNTTAFRMHTRTIFPELLLTNNFLKDDGIKESGDEPTFRIY